ncbi:hypothetical protein BLA17378_02263 [Burkholderia aenigmatica]|uniref:Uncharacterized protein n=1 Tax=Burkholderia aenigmatica TaxID=2015348 RepID=A0ABY6XU59_9BURK|nr:hypothetical protein BLA17378_02263 [Burkholderia aenigmatica]
MQVVHRTWLSERPRFPGGICTLHLTGQGQ